MDPSKEKKQDAAPPEKKQSKRPVVLLITLLLVSLCGVGFFFYTSRQTTEPPKQDAGTAPVVKEALFEEITVEKEATGLIEETDIENTSSIPFEETTIDAIGFEPTIPDEIQPEQKQKSKAAPVPVTKKPEKAPTLSVCDKPVAQLDAFYTHLDTQAYMLDYKLGTPSKTHFTVLIDKLLANPPQVTRESDDLYTILKNTAHFFRVSGKDNILMMKGILDSEKGSLENILADYYLLVTTPECTITPYGDIDKDGLYEYACFFLNTMGGRLYLFRRDSLSRMVVTYYAILLVDQANIHNNNRHGISLRPVVDMLISEMETGGSSLKKSAIYLDQLYDLKEKYQ